MLMKENKYEIHVDDIYGAEISDLANIPSINMRMVILGMPMMNVWKIQKKIKNF